MVRLSEMPSQATIDGYKGLVDFYLWKGVPCARRWPRYTPRNPTDAERANQERFAYINKLASSVGPEVREYYSRMAAGTSWTWKDLFVRAYMTGIDY